MEEKERYLLFIGQCCVDKEDKNKLINGLDRLNQQDKHIKELKEEVIYHKNYIREEWKIKNNFLNEIKQLKQENLSLQEQSIRDNQNLIEEIEKLKQSQKQLAISELEKVQNLFSGTQIQLYLDNRIKELKGW